MLSRQQIIQTAILLADGYIDLVVGSKKRDPFLLALAMSVRMSADRARLTKSVKKGKKK